MSCLHNKTKISSDAVMFLKQLHKHFQREQLNENLVISLSFNEIAPDSTSKKFNSYNIEPYVGFYTREQADEVGGSMHMGLEIVFAFGDRSEELSQNLKIELVDGELQFVDALLK